VVLIDVKNETTIQMGGAAAVFHHQNSILFVAQDKSVRKLELPL